MNLAEPSSTGLSSARPHAAAPLRLVALYGDPGAAAYAHEAVGSITLAAGASPVVTSGIWSFDMLTRLDLRHASIRSAVRADVIIVASSASAPLPAHVDSWFTACLRENRHHAPVLVALYEQERDLRHGAPLPVLRRDLGCIAARWCSCLLCNQDLRACLRSGFLSQNGGRRAMARPPVALAPHVESLLARDHCACGGINE